MSQQFKRLKAQDAGRTERARQLGQSIAATERLIGQIIGDDEFRFITTDEDNDVRARWNGRIVDLDLLPDGLKSITSWIADLLMRLDRIAWVDNRPVLERPFLLLLDEMDIHLHPAWQRQVLPFVQKMFPNAQIIATTHSPFVVSSVVDAHIVTFALKEGVSTVEHVAPSQMGVSYGAVLRSIFGIDSEFDVATEDDFRKFHEAKARLLSGEAAARTLRWPSDRCGRGGSDRSPLSQERAGVLRAGMYVDQPVPHLLGMQQGQARLLARTAAATRRRGLPLRALLRVPIRHRRATSQYRGAARRPGARYQDDRAFEA